MYVCAISLSFCVFRYFFVFTLQKSRFLIICNEILQHCNDFFTILQHNFAKVLCYSMWRCNDFLTTLQRHFTLHATKFYNIATKFRNYFVTATTFYSECNAIFQKYYVIACKDATIFSQRCNDILRFIFNNDVFNFKITLSSTLQNMLGTDFTNLVNNLQKSYPITCNPCQRFCKQCHLFSNFVVNWSNIVNNLTNVQDTVYVLTLVTQSLLYKTNCLVVKG